MRFFLALIAISLPFVAWRLNQKSVAIIDDAIDAPHTIHNPLPPERAGDFFGEDPRIAAQSPRGKRLLFIAQLVDISAMACMLASPMFLALAVIPRRPQMEKPQCGIAEKS